MDIKEVYTQVNAKARGDGFIGVGREDFVIAVTAMQFNGKIVVENTGDVRPAGEVQG